jgi:O-antigen/teichoic acid export membrane protein
MLVSALLTSLYSEIRTLLVGYKYSTAELADYNKGFQFPNVISNTLDVSIQSVMLPVMARAQDEPERLNRMLFRTLTLSMFMVVPVMLGLAAVAETLIPMLLGPEWGSCVPLMCVFCLSDLMLPVKSTNLSLLKATGRSDIYMKTEMVRRVIMLAVLLVTVLLFDSVLVIAIGYALNSWLDAYIITRAVRVQTGVSWWQQIRTLWKTLLSGAVMLALVWAMNYLPVLPILRLLMQIASGAAAYVLLSALLKNEAFFFVLGKIRSLLGRKGQRQNAG